MDLAKIQAEIKKGNFDGWLLYDFHQKDLIAYKVLGLDSSKITSRRWFYFIPAEGEPKRLVHSVESTKLDSLPGTKTVYLPYEQLHASLKEMLGSPKKIAMQYSPNNDIPYVSMVDAGTVELLRSFGHEIVSSADLVQTFEAIIDEKGYKLHLKAGEIVLDIKNQAYKKIEKALQTGEQITEYEIQQFIVQKFKENGLTDDGEHPIVCVNDHPADPHFEPTPENSYVIKKGDTILIDLWARIDDPGGIYYDITWCGYAGKNPPEKYVEIFNVVRDARNAAVKFIRDKFAKSEPCFGWEVDDACRNVIKATGYGEYFIHRTGHSIGTCVHGNGVHIDNLETKDVRQVVPGICFSIEPGLYFVGEMAIRTEINVFVTLQSEVVVAGDEQSELILLDV